MSGSGIKRIMESSNDMLRAKVEKAYKERKSS